MTPDPKLIAAMLREYAAIQKRRAGSMVEATAALAQAAAIEQPGMVVVPSGYMPHGMEGEHYRLLYGFILDCNKIGPMEAGVNLARGIKESVAMIAAAQGDKP